MKAHRLTLSPPVEHRTWRSECSCGWVDRPSARRQTTVLRWHHHARVVAPRRACAYLPRPLTPVELLPVDLAPTVVVFS